MPGSGSSRAHFSPRRRTAVVLTGEGTAAFYLAGVMRALDAAGVRMDVVLGRGAGALVTAFSAFHAEEKICGEGGILQSLTRGSAFRLASLYRFAALCFSVAFGFFAAPALLGLVSIVLFPVQALVRGVSPGWLSRLVAVFQPYYLPAVALPILVLFIVLSVRFLLLLWKGGGRRPTLTDFFPPLFDSAPLERLLEGRLWQLVRGTATEARPRDRRALSEAYVQLLTAGLGQHGFREIVFYTLDTDTGQETPFVVLKDRFAKKMRAGVGRAEPVDLALEGAPTLFDSLLAASSPPGLAPEVAIKLPRGTKFGGEVHRFVSSLWSGRGALPDALCVGAEQILYVTSAATTERASGSLWERLSATALAGSLEDDLAWAAERTEVPVFVIRPDAEKLTPFEISGRAQLGGERLTASVLVDQGERDAERLFIRPVLGEELPRLPHEATVPVDRDWEAGPKEL